MGIAGDNKHGGKGGGAWMWLPWERVKLIRIAEDDPGHEEHELHKWRTSLDRPKFAGLVESIRTLGLDALANVPPILIYLDGDVSTVANGRRTLAALRIVNAERKPADRLPVRAMTTKDPAMARDASNSNREEDPPMWLAKRYVRAYAVDGDKKGAAARLGLMYSHAETLRKCLALPQDWQAKINNLETSPDIALRLYANGGAEAREAIAAVSDGDGKIDAVKARDKTKRKARAKIEGPPALRPATLKALTGDLCANEFLTQKDMHMLAGIRLAAGDMTVLDAYPGILAAFKRQRIDVVTGRAKAGRKPVAK